MSKLRVILIKGSWPEFATISKIMSCGWGNGYVVIPQGHPLHTVHYSDQEMPDFKVHGGLTFSSFEGHHPKFKEYGVDENDWIIGFDTAHYSDNPDYWTMNRVHLEAINLAKQIDKRYKTN